MSSDGWTENVRTSARRSERTAFMSKTWFITGAARGFGRLWAEGALGRGDRVAASVRNPEPLADLLDAYGDRVLPLRVDVTDRDAVFEAVATAHGHFGRLDVILSNAGYGLMGAIEETSYADTGASSRLMSLGRFPWFRRRCRFFEYSAAVTSFLFRAWPAWWPSPRLGSMKPRNSPSRVSPKRSLPRSAPSASGRRSSNREPMRPTS